jgi:signal transduction histidine kinase/ligand-binding sensor domain-containing protein/DNA-binding response OmpR family regulator
MKKLKNYLWAITLLLLTILPKAHAQNGKFYTTEQGLSSSLINHLLQDDRGYLWIATEYGLNRFDGLKFMTYYHADGDSTSLSSNYVHTLFEDSHLRLFVGCIDGLMQYRRETDDFRNIPMMNGEKAVKAHVTRMVETADGTVLIATTGQGLYRLDTDGKAAHCISDEWNTRAYAYLSYIYIDTQKRTWLGTDGQGLLERTKQGQAVTPHALPDNFVTRLAEDAEGDLYIGTLNRGLHRLSPSTGQITSIPLANPPGDYAVMSLAQIDGQLLVGTDGQGLKRYDAKAQKLVDDETPSSPINLSDAKVHAILKDRDGNLWLGLFQKGIAFIPRQANPFTYYGPQSAYYNPIGKSCVMSVFSDSRHHLWTGLDHDGLYELDEHGQRLHHYTSDHTPRTVPSTIMCITEDSQHRIWLGSYGQGLACLDPVTGRVSYLPFLDKTVVMSVTEDDEQHLYIATMALGLFRYSLTDGKWTHYGTSRDGKNNLQRNEMANDWVNRVYRDSQGRLWLGHYSGVSCFDPKARSFTALNGKNLIINNCIGYSFLDDHRGSLWAGTSKGLYRIDMKTGDYTLITTANGLCDNVVGGLCMDADGHLWASTFRGMSHYDPILGACVNFYAGDGLQSNEFTNGAYYQDADGRCYFGGVGGLTTFVPEEMTDNTRPMQVWITEFSVDGQPVRSTTLSNGSPIIDTSVEEAETFHLSYLDNSFGLTFSTLQYGNAEKTSYRYRMDGIHSQWVETDPGVNHIQYNKLPPGTYTLHVQAMMRGHLSEERTVLIVIASPWYRTGWAYLGYFVALALVACALANQLHERARQRQLMLEQEHAEQINEAKLQFFINIAHEIRTPMTLILSPIEKLMAEDRDSGRHESYRLIHRNARRILHLVNQLMDVRKLDKGQMKLKFSETDMVDFIREGMLPFEVLAKKKEITLEFHHEMDTLTTWVDPNNFDKVLVNLGSNAFKYTPQGGRIDITLTTGTDGTRTDALARYFEIAVEDSGIGIDPSQLERIFDRFYQIDNAVTQHSIGSGVGLHLTRQLVTLHHGTIHAECRPEGGSRFLIRLPLGKDHLTPEELATETPVLAPTTATAKTTEPTKAHALAEKNEPTKTTHPTETAAPAQPQTHYPAMAAMAEVDVPDQPAYSENTRRSKALPLVLIAEDDEEIARYLLQELSDQYRVTTCSNGKEALNSALRKHPDLVISDVMMPEMDGLTLCHKLKQNTEVNHIPVVLLTAKTRQEDNREGIEAGADAYMTKPFSIDILRATIQNLLSNRHLLHTKYSGAQQQQDKVKPLEIKSADEQLMERIMNVINQHLDDPSLSVEMLSTEVGISRVHIHRKMKELTNQTTRDFIKNIRLQQAATLMEQNAGLSVSDVAYKVGFSNLSHFSTSFKEKYGLSPKDYMEQHR